MITKEELKNEIDSLPEGALDRVHFFILNELSNDGSNNKKKYLSDEWTNNLNEFTPDFMEAHERYPTDSDREPFG